MLTNVCRWYNLSRAYHRIRLKLCRKPIVILIIDAIRKFQAWRRKYSLSIICNSLDYTDLYFDNYITCTFTSPPHCTVCLTKVVHSPPKASSPQSAIYFFLLQFPGSCRFPKVIQQLLTSFPLRLVPFIFSSILFLRGIVTRDFKITGYF